MKKFKQLVEQYKKIDVPAYLRKQKGEKPLTMDDVKAPRKDSISAKENLAKARNEEVGISESGGPVVYKKGEQHIEKYGEDSFALYKDGKKQKFYTSIEAAKSAMNEDVEQIDEKNVPTSPEKWAQAKSQAKAKFDVYPSAYANGWAAKKYKAMGGSWKSVDEAVKDKFDIGEYDQEGDMAKSDLRSIIANAQRVHDMLKDDTNMPEWVQSKITLAEDYISTVANYMTAEMNEEWSKTGKTATHRETGQKTYEYHKVNKEGKPTGEREYRNAQGKPMGEAVETIDEISKDLAGRYLEKVAYDQTKKHGMKSNLYSRLKPKQQKGVDRALDRLAVKEETKPPFDKPYVKVKKTITDKSGAKHTPMSRARDIARKAMQKQIEGMKKMPVKEETRKASIVKEVMKKKVGSENAFQKDPELSTTLTKV